jgi:hypothetical protein
MWQNAVFLNVKKGGTYSYHSALKGLIFLLLSMQFRFYFPSDLIPINFTAKISGRVSTFHSPQAYV